MTKKRLYIFLAIGALIAYVSYEAVRTLYLIDRPTLGMQRGSDSEAKSRAGGFYIGKYVPTRRLIQLKDGSIIHVPDAWVEHAWRPKLTLLLQDRQELTAGYYFYIPVHPDESIGSKETWPFKFGLDLNQQTQRISQRPGIGYQDIPGFFVSLDMLPASIEITVVQKKNESDSWNDAIPVENIEFRRAF
jgi:hypothetical protein